MTNPALEDFDRIAEYFISGCGYGERAKWQNKIETIRTAVANSPQWMPIESAPRDGTRILLTRNNYTVAAGHYKNGWWSGWPLTQHTPTHWMPLPAAPVTAATDGGGG